MSFITTILHTCVSWCVINECSRMKFIIKLIDMYLTLIALKSLMTNKFIKINWYSSPKIFICISIGNIYQTCV